MRTAHFTIVSTTPDGAPSVYRAHNREDWLIHTRAVYLDGHTDICASEFIEYRLLGVGFSRRAERYLRCRHNAG